MMNWKSVTINGQSVKQITLDGKLLFKSSKLPSEYQQVEWIGSSGSQYIDTGYKPNGNTIVNANIYTLDTTTISAICAQDNGWKNLGYSLALQYSEYYSTEIGAGLNNNTKYKISFGTSYYVNDVLRSSWSKVSFQALYSLHIFGSNRRGTNQERCSIRLYDMQIYEDTTLIKDYVPCFRKSDGVIGLYDLVNNEFKINNGTGVFTIPVDTSLELNSSNNTICTINNRRYWKTYSGLSIAGYLCWYDGSNTYTGPIIMGKTINNATYTADSGGPFVPSNARYITYRGETWYYSLTEHAWSGNLSDTSGTGRLKLNNGDPVSSYADGALELVKRYYFTFDNNEGGDL